MDYIILSIDESRAEKKANIRSLLSDWSERSIVCVNGHSIQELKEAQLLTGVQSRPMLSGELGVWYSTVNAWINIANNGEAVVFEDDALLRSDFKEVFQSAYKHLPLDADFLSLFIPFNQAQDYYYLTEYDSEGIPTIVATGVSEERSIFNIGSSHVAKAYMGYGNVAIFYTSQGAFKLLDIAKKRGIYTPVDCFLFLQAHAGNINGYALHPQHKGVVDVDPDASTLIHFGQILQEGF